MVKSGKDDSVQSEAETAPSHSDGKDPEQFVLCYLSCPKDASGAYLGALMLTDSRSRPLHFAYIAPVSPTKMQRILYGSTLEQHLRIDLIANNLLRGMPRVPDALFVDAPDLVSARRIAGLPTAHLAKKDDADLAESGFSTLKYTTYDGTDDQDVIGRILATLEDATDLIEPFDRMQEALKEAIRNKGK